MLIFYACTSISPILSMREFLSRGSITRLVSNLPYSEYHEETNRARGNVRMATRRACKIGAGETIEEPKNRNTVALRTFGLRGFRVTVLRFGGVSVNIVPQYEQPDLNFYYLEPQFSFRLRA